jgi:serine/threonine protein kinase
MRLAAARASVRTKSLARSALGGMAKVYKTKDTRLDRTAAIKILPSDISGDRDLYDACTVRQHVLVTKKPLWEDA